MSAYARRLTVGDTAAAEDLVHDAYVALVVPRGGDGRVERLGTGWLMVAVRRRFLNHVRDGEREQRRLIAAVAADPATR